MSHDTAADDTARPTTAPARRTPRHRRRAADLAPRSRRRRRLGDRRVRPVRHRPHRDRIRPVPRPVAVVGRSPRGVLGRGLGLLRHRGGRQPRGGARSNPPPPCPAPAGFPAPGSTTPSTPCAAGPATTTPWPSPPSARTATTSQTTWAQLRAEVAALAQWLRGAGVQRGDRVVGYLPDTTPTLVAFLAAASVGAIWSACAPGLRRRRRRRPVRPARAGGPVRRRRLPVERPGARPPRRGRGAAAGAAHAAGHRPHHQRRPAVRPAEPEPAAPGDRQLGGGDRAAGRAPLRPGRLRRAAVGAVLVRHHRPAQGHRARSRRRPARALQAPRPAPRRRP